MGQQDPTFILGLGAQKAGTTWLQAYLAHFDISDFGLCKEYHVWDAVHLPACAEFDLRGTSFGTRRELRDMARRLTGRGRETPFMRRSFQRDEEAYFDYFAGLLQAPGVRLTGDITPSYSGLPAAAMARIRDGFFERGIDVKVVFLMRDPIERARSALRMYRRNAQQTDLGPSYQGADLTADIETALLDYLATPEARLRGDYPDTLRRIEEVFEPRDTYLGFYETMFTRAEFDRLNAFFGLDPDEAFLEQKFNVTARSDDLSEETVTRARALLADIYDGCRSRYPDLDARWRA